MEGCEGGMGQCTESLPSIGTHWNYNILSREQGVRLAATVFRYYFLSMQ